MSETATKQFLDKDGLDALWGKMCETFPHKDALGNYLPLAGGAMTGPITFNLTDADRNVIRINNGTYTDSTVGQYGYTLKYLGSGSGDNNSLALFSDNGTATTQNKAIEIKQSGNIHTRNIIPLANNTYSLGNSSYKWSNIYATTFTGNATSATTASKLSNTTAIGSVSEPVYFTADGVPAVCSHAIKTVAIYDKTENRLKTAGWYTIATLSSYGTYLLSISGSYSNVNSTAASFIINKSYTAANIYQLSPASVASMITKVRLVTGETSGTIHVEVYNNYTGTTGQPFVYRITTLMGINTTGSDVVIQDPVAVTHSLTVKQELTIATTAAGLLPTHTHSYLPLSGGTMTGTITSQSIVPSATNTYNLGTTDNKWKTVCATTFNGDLNGSITAKDIRELTGVTSDFGNRTFGPFFSNVTMPSSNWWSGFTSKGWTNDYNSWQLVGFSGQGDASAQDLYFRTGINDVWNGWKKMLDNSNTTYTPIVTSSTSGAYQIGTLKIGDTETTLYGKDTNTTYTSLPNPNALTIQGNGTTLTNGVYDGSAPKTVNITPASIGAAAAPVTYRTQSNETGFYKISINSTAAWMLAFRVRVYKAYQYFDIRFSGYNYQSNYWHAAQASIVDGDASTTVYMGYDDVNKLWVAIPAAQYTGIEIADCVNGFASTGKSLSELFTITRVDSLSGTTEHTYTLYPPSKINHTHNYLPLSGGTISSSSFCPLVIERSGSALMASIKFKNSNGELGSIGMNTVYGSLLLHNADGTLNKTILDSSNYSSYALPKSGGTISGLLSITRSPSAIKFNNSAGTVLGYIGFNADDDPVAYKADGSTMRHILHSGNYSTYAAPASHTHTIVSTGNVVPALTGTLNNGVLEIKGLATDVSVTGITDPPGTDNSPESWFIDPTDMDELFNA